VTRYQPFTLKLGGLNEDENPAALERNDCSIARNSWRRGTSRGTRPGFNRDTLFYTNSAGLGDAVNGIVDYRFANDASQFLVVVANGDIFRADATSIKNAGTAVTAGANHRWTFAQHKGVLYGAGGTGTNNFWSWPGSGTTSNIAMVDLSAAAIYPTYVFEKWNFGFTCGFRNSLGNLATDLSSGPMIVRYSDLNDMTTWPTGSTFGGTSAVGGFSSYGDEFLTGFGEFSNNAGDWLLALSNKRLYAVGNTGDSVTPFYTPPVGVVMNGCVHQNAFVSLGLDSGDAIYLSRVGIHSVRISEQFGERIDSFLSWKIRQTFRTLNQTALHRSVGAYDPKRGFVIFAVPTGSNTNPDTILCLDVKNNANLTAKTVEWDIWSMAGSLTADQRLITALATARTDSGTTGFFVYGGNAEGDVGRFDDSSSGSHSDLGSPYDVRMRTRHEDFGLSGVTKGLGDIYVTLQPGGSHRPTVTPIFDYGDSQGTPLSLRMPASGELVGALIVGSGIVGGGQVTTMDKVYPRGDGETIALEFRHSGTNEPFYIAQATEMVQTHGYQDGGE
jgi:hypothetical protein